PGRRSRRRPPADRDSPGGSLPGAGGRRLRRGRPAGERRFSPEVRSGIVFNSFFFAGFECATGWNSQGEWIDQVAATQHDVFARDDYRRLSEAGLHAAREGVRWPLVDRNGRYDFSTVRPFVEAAREFEVEVVWDLFHYGYPEGVDLFSDAFVERF